MECHETPGGDVMTAAVTIYTTRWCPFCVRAKSLLQQKGVAFSEIPVDGDSQLRAEMAARAGRTSVPQIWFGDQHIGGCDELFALERRGELEAMLLDDR